MLRTSLPPDLSEAPARDATELAAAADVEAAHYSPDEELADTRTLPPDAPGEEDDRGTAPDAAP
jgi:hypothetical protein